MVIQTQIPLLHEDFKWEPSVENKTVVDLLCERRTVLRSAASSKSFIVFSLCSYLVAAVGASWEPDEIRPATPAVGVLCAVELEEKDWNQVVAHEKGTEIV